MAGNSEIFKRANVLMKQGHDRKQAFAIAYAERDKDLAHLFGTDKPKHKAARAKKNPAQKKHDPTYWVIVTHPAGYLSFRSDSGYTGSQPYSSLPGNTVKQKVSAFIKQLGIKRGQYEVIAENPAPKRKTRAVTQKAAVSYVNRPSQITKKSPTKRLRVRRTKNLRVPVGVFPNPIPRGSVDSVYAQEIFLFGQNDGDLYRQRTTYMIDNLAKKYAAGKYNETLALKMWRIWADEADKRYNKEYSGQSAGFLTNVPTRDLIAQKARDYYFEHVVQESAKFAKTKTRKNPVSEKTTKREKRGLFEQPEFPFRVESSTDGNKWRAEGSFRTEMIAREYARALDRKSGGRVWIRVTE